MPSAEPNVSQSSAVAAAHVPAGCEDVAGAGDQQAREVGVGVDVPDRIPDAEVHRRRHRVAGLRPVQRADAERALPVKRRYGVPSQSPSGGRGVLSWSS